MVGQEDSMIECIKNNSIVPNISPVLYLYHFKSVTVIKARQNGGHQNPIYKASDGSDARDRLEFYHSMKSLTRSVNDSKDNAPLRDQSNLYSSIKIPRFRAVSSYNYQNPIQVGICFSSKCK